LRKRLQAIIETIILFLLGPQFGVAGRDDVPSTSDPTGATGVSEMDVDVTSRGMVVGQLCSDPALFVELAKRLVKDEAARVKLKIEPLVTCDGVEHESRPGVVDNVVRILFPEFVLT